ncbi:MAG: hypothetical protein ACI4GY_10975 [Acutalibacteraceae bacterium]
MKTEKIKLLQKPPKGKMAGLLIVFAWIILWNIIYQACHDILTSGSIQVINWSFFISVTIFFMQEELSYKERFWHTLIGGSVGLLIAAGVVAVCKALMGVGLSHFVAICIPLVVAIGMLILLHPYLPMFFNNVGFCYFIISLINSKETISSLPSNLLSLALGSIILNLGCSLLLTLYINNKKKKAASKAKEPAAAKE